LFCNIYCNFNPYISLVYCSIYRETILTFGIESRKEENFDSFSIEHPKQGREGETEKKLKTYH
jgi:hypothetical protein